MTELRSSFQPGVSQNRNNRKRKHEVLPQFNNEDLNYICSNKRLKLINGLSHH